MADLGLSTAHRRSPFDGHLPSDHATRDGRTGVSLWPEMLHSVLLTSTWPNGVKPWLAALRKALGQRLPKSVGDSMMLRTGLTMRVGPEEIMLVSEPGQPESHELLQNLRQHVTAQIGAVLDLSHARCRIGIKGPNAVDTLAKLYALDFREAAFPLHRVQLTAHHHLPCVLHRTGEQAFDAYVFTTYARDQLATLADAALEFGIDCQPRQSR